MAAYIRTIEPLHKYLQSLQNITSRLSNVLMQNNRKWFHRNQ